MKDVAAPTITYLKDYKPVNFKIEKIELQFDVYEEKTVVDAVMTIQMTSNEKLMELNGSTSLKLNFVKIDDTVLTTDSYSLKNDNLYIQATKDKFVLHIQTEIIPHQNLSLVGLYFAGGNYFTQNEPHGFRHITYYGDRPDVLSVFTTKIIASKKYTSLLSNGNLINSGVDSKNSERYFATWNDPFPKPSYLFALVIGNFEILKDEFITKSQKKVALEIYVDPGNMKFATHAMQSLKNSMQWDEEKFSLEYDLDTYMIVAAESFNMGAMENKGLNIFNSKYVLGDQETATDDDLEAIEAVIAHEYFHNWTGNRVTCRDWFQLTLKEGLTVFRDQEFTADLHGHAVKRIKDVQLLRQKQFDEDAGPLSHPIRPESYIEMNNFYTVTVYEKGAEVVRMLQTILGVENFKKSIKHYFELYDGKAVTTENFIHAFEEACSIDLTHFKNWYHTKGTPLVNWSYEKVGGNIFKLKIEQSWKEHPVQDLVSLPLKIALIDAQGECNFKLRITSGAKSKVQSEDKSEAVLLVQDKSVEAEIEYQSTNLPVVSFNRSFSSPIKIEKNFNLGHIKLLAKNDNDQFNKWDSCQDLLSYYLNQHLNNGTIVPDKHFTDSVCELWRSQLRSNSEDNNYFNSLFLSLPSEDEINDVLPQFKFNEVRTLVLNLKYQVAGNLLKELKTIFKSLKPIETSWTPEEVGKRKLKNKLLDLLVSVNDAESIEHALNVVKNSKSMNEQYAALTILNAYDIPSKAEANECFIQRHHQNSLLVDKWLSAQVSNLKSQDLCQVVKDLMASKYFDIKIPNRIYALFIRWMQNLPSFNDSNSGSYALMSKVVLEIDQFNPHVAARILKGIKPLKKLNDELHTKLKAELEQIRSFSKTSKDCLELVEKYLKG